LAASTGNIVFEIKSGTLIETTLMVFASSLAGLAPHCGAT
jgi:hypothetical protein